MRKKQPPLNHATAPRLQAIVIEFHHPTAVEVCVTGNFIDWKPSALPMIRLEGGRWFKELMLPPGRHEYRLIVDGQWADDPKASEFVENPFGSRNAVVAVNEG